MNRPAFVVSCLATVRRRELDTGHFALEDKLPEIASLLARFLDRLARA